MQSSIQHKLDHISQQLQGTQQQMIVSQSKKEALQNAIMQLKEIEAQLEEVKATESDALTNPQWQQSYEQLHDLRRNINHLMQ
ncbi:hypothetical protein Pryu01_02239 [Paraliobacillus ryukyuensis]|uniref:Uncharacterized protein n=1 Tax=Paraliobacillus ryukyuensis TaxID=200904 RepID=A0A366E6L6_9BACI|nr:hypothetical protein [Paraliobacillus ryukyuensis]RBO98013.1 hypothetical protein DES48_10633 [Paraliobacillus ryukyuensis]